MNFFPFVLHETSQFIIFRLEVLQDPSFLSWVGHPLQWDPFVGSSPLQWDPFFFLDRSPVTMRPFIHFFTWVCHPLQWDPFFVFFFHQVGHPLQWNHLKKQKKEEKLNKKREEGFSQLFFFTKLTIQSQKKIIFLMPLHCKHCEEGATIVTQFWPFGF